MKTTTLFAFAIFVSQFTFAQNNNYSVDFDGVADYLNIPTSNDFDAINSSLTITAWIKPDSTSTGASPRIVDRSEGNGGGVDRWLLTWTPTFQNLVMSFAVGSTGTEAVYGATPIVLNEWTYISAVFDAGNVSIYINGQLDGSGTISFTDLLHVQGADINIASTNGVNSFFPGLIDEITIWDSALDSLTIQQYMECSPVGNELNLLGYWDLEEGTGVTAADITANMNDGNLTNGAIWSGDVPYLNCGLGIEEFSQTKKELVKITDLMGRETEFRPNTILIYMFSDGSTQKVMQIK
jgi:hypothetical protein